MIQNCPFASANEAHPLSLLPQKNSIISQNHTLKPPLQAILASHSPFRAYFLLKKATMTVCVLHKGKGFSLIEAMIGVAMFGIAFFALYSGLTFCCTNLQFSQENLRATEIMVKKLEAIRLYSWEQVNDPTFLPRTFAATYDASPIGSSGSSRLTYQGTLEIGNAPITANYSDDLRLVTVNLSWQTGKVTRQRSMQSLVAFSGLYYYVY